MNRSAIGFNSIAQPVPPMRIEQVKAPVYLPEFHETAHRYYRTHFDFVLNILRQAGCNFEFYLPDISPDLNRCLFHCQLNDFRILFDVSDYHDIPPHDALNSVDAVFKFHLSPMTSQCNSIIFPFSPISFYDWGQYSELEKTIRYHASGLILGNQRPHCQNRERRNYVQELLQKIYGEKFDSTLTEQVAFWHKISNAAVSVCVPGSRIDILDRGQLQYMAFGACTISPKLSIELPRAELLMPNVHYLECKADWSDLIEKIAWTCTHRDSCVKIGGNAKCLFRSTLTAEALFEWMNCCLSRL
jgi:hypothetical protein